MYNEIVSQPLARIVYEEALTGPRGPDGRYEIVVPGGWLEERAWIEVSLPRLLSCASCNGGGCDQCARRGAVATRPQKFPDEVIELQLPSSGPVLVRLPRRGGLPSPEQEALGRGVLLLAIQIGVIPSEGLRKLTSPAVTTLMCPSVPARAPLSPQFFGVLVLGLGGLIGGLLWGIAQFF